MKDFNEVHIDVMREIGTIGSGNAATALSQLVGYPINIALPVAKTLEYSQAAEEMGGEETMVVGLLLMMSGEVDGMIMFLMHKDFVHTMINALLRKNIESFEQLDEMDYSALKEVSSIMAASYVNAISTMTNLSIKLSTPDIAIDMLGAILSVPTIYFAHMGDKMIYIKGSFIGKELDVPCNVLMLPDMDSLEKIIKKLGIDI